jgi:hypothetical protein
MTNKRPVNVTKGKQGFQETAKAEPTTGLPTDARVTAESAVRRSRESYDNLATAQARDELLLLCHDINCDFPQVKELALGFNDHNGRLEAHEYDTSSDLSEADYRALDERINSISTETKARLFDEHRQGRSIEVAPSTLPSAGNKRESVRIREGRLEETRTEMIRGEYALAAMELRDNGLEEVEFELERFHYGSAKRLSYTPTSMTLAEDGSEPLLDEADTELFNTIMTRHLTDAAEREIVGRDGRGLSNIHASQADWTP